MEVKMVIRKQVLIIALPITIIWMFACILPNDQIKESPGTISDSKTIEAYLIEPENALENLRQNNKIILVPISTSFDEHIDSVSPVENKTFLWSYDDYFKAINNVKEQTWGSDALSEWELLWMTFGVDCQEQLDGFSDTNFYYYQLLESGGESVYAGRQLLIRPAYGDIISGSGTTYPYPTFGWSNIDLKKIKFTANDALNIAEMNGGRQFRTSIKDECRVSVAYTAGDKNGWIISYNSRKGSLRFDVQVDPYTGKYEILSN
jgi:hypothetical protein